MYSRPALYLNGTAPLNVTGAVRACVLQRNEPNGPEDQLEQTKIAFYGTLLSSKKISSNNLKQSGTTNYIQASRQTGWSLEKLLRSSRVGKTSGQLG